MRLQNRSFSNTFLHFVLPLEKLIRIEALFTGVSFLNIRRKYFNIYLVEGGINIKQFGVIANKKYCINNRPFKLLYVY